MFPDQICNVNYSKNCYDFNEYLHWKFSKLMIPETITFIHDHLRLVSIQLNLATFILRCLTTYRELIKPYLKRLHLKLLKFRFWKLLKHNYYQIFFVLRTKISAIWSLIWWIKDSSVKVGHFQADKTIATKRLFKEFE